MLLNLKNIKIFRYSSNPEILTGEIETLTNYSQRKRNLELRKKMFEDKEDEQSKKELAQLEQLYDKIVLKYVYGKEGANIVVNDLGGDRDGSGGGRIADEVVEEIKKRTLIKNKTETLCFIISAYGRTILKFSTYQ